MKMLSWLTAGRVAPCRGSPLVLCQITSERSHHPSLWSASATRAGTISSCLASYRSPRLSHSVPSLRSSLRASRRMVVRRST